MTPAEIIALIAAVEQIIATLPAVSADFMTAWNNIKQMLSGSTAVVPQATLDEQATALTTALAALQAEAAKLKAASPAAVAAVGGTATAPA